METAPLDPPLSGRFVAVVPLIRGIPPKGGRGFVFEALPLIRGSPRRGRGFVFRGSPPASLSGRNPPLIPPYQGGKKLSPFGVALLPCREWKPPFIREVCCRCPPDKGDPPEGGRGFCRCPLLRRIPPEGGGGLFVRGSHPTSLSGRKPPLIPPYQGGKKLSPFGVALLPCREWNPPLIREVCCRCPPDKGDPPEGGRGFVFKSLPPKGGVPPLLPYREWKPPLNPLYQGGLLPLSP